MGNFLSDNWGNLASIAGLGVGILAYIQAAKATQKALSASRMAKKVRDELSRKALADELSNLRHLITPATLLIREKSPRAAVELINPGINAILLLHSRWDNQLSHKMKDRLTSSIAQLKSAVETMCEPSLDDAGYHRCLTATEKALHAIVEAQGLALAEVERISKDQMI